MNKVQILKICVYLNFSFLLIFSLLCIFFNNNEGTYFRCGWSDDLVFVSINIDSSIKYLCLCLFIITMNFTEVFLNDIASPLITFSTYNPYKIEISDFTRMDLEIYSNLIVFIKLSKGLLSIATTVTQIDLAIISLFSSQIAAFSAIRYLLNNKTFVESNIYVEVPYGSVSENTNLV